MPSGKKINWAKHDPLIKKHLPSMTVRDFTRKFLPSVSDKAVGSRARKIGIQPAAYKPSDDHKKSISSTISKLTSDDIAFITTNINRMTINELAEALHVSKSTINRVVALHGIKMSSDGIAFKREKTRHALLGRKPWNKNKTLSKETKNKISIAVSGNKNGQYGRGMTESEKTKWRESYFKGGIEKMRRWVASPEGLAVRQRSIEITTSKEFREKQSKLVSKMIRNGKIRPSYAGYKSTVLTTKKGGTIRTRSSYETKYAKIVDNDPAVLSFEYEPFSLQYEYDGTHRWYTPDFLVRYYDRIEVVEVKPERMLTIDDKNPAKFRAAATYSLEEGLIFKIVTESRLFKK